IGLHGAAEVVDAVRHPVACGDRGRRELPVNDRSGDDILWIKGREATGEIFEFPDVARPTMLLQALERRGIELFWWQAILFGQREEVSDQIRQVFDSFAQWRQPQRHHVE